jgi:hypothetical protein
VFYEVSPVRGRKTIPDITIGKRGDAMTPSLPCAKCGQVDDLETIHPTGIVAGQFVEWECPCGINRLVEINRHVPQELIRKAIEAEKRAKTFEEGV